MSIALLHQNGEYVCRLFMRSQKLRATRSVKGGVEIGVRADLLTRAPLDALASLGLREEAAFLSNAAKDWRWLTPSEFAAALEADATQLEQF